MTDMRHQIIATANSLGMAPETLATIISYETAGTFDPSKAGPTTQWGQHRGLIQFGEPQAKQYGADFTNADTAMQSQLGPDGAIAKYYRANGWKDGMGMMDAYSIVNAGGPGRYGASDANNGGAPGTVADKVNNQMASHRDKAIAMLGMDASGPVAPQNPLAQAHADLSFSDKIKGMFDGTYKPDTASMGNTLASMVAAPAEVAPIQMQQQAAYQPTDRVGQYYQRLMKMRGQA